MKFQSLWKTLAVGVLSFGMAAAVAEAQVYVHIGPPRPIVERRPPPPGRAMYGGRDTTAGMAVAMSGYRANISLPRVRTHITTRARGSTMDMVIAGVMVIGANSLNPPQRLRKFSR